MTIAKKTLFTAKTEFGSYKVVDRVYNYRPARVLYGTGKSPQSGVAFDDEPELLFHYNQRFLEVAESINPTSILIIGGGAFTLPTVLFNRFQDTTIDVVEIDPALTAIARDYFNLPDDVRLTITNMDGRAYIDTCTKKYDLIILDAFAGYDIPTALLTAEAVAQYKRCLTPKGLIAVNFISTYHTYKRMLTHEVLSTFESVLEYVDLYPSDHGNERRSEQNLLLTAARQMISLDYLQASPIQVLFQPEDAVLHDSTGE